MGGGVCQGREQILLGEAGEGDNAAPSGEGKCVSRMTIKRALPFQ
jgi:hypothetical protein